MLKRRVLGPLAVMAHLALALVLAFSLAACTGGASRIGSADTSAASRGADASQDAPKPTSKTLVIGYENYPPSCYLDEDGEPTGIDMDIAKEALRRMGYEPVFKEVDWLDKDKLLAAGEIDCIWCSFSMDGREDAYTWAGPYMYSDEVVVVPSASPIKTLADLTGKTVGVAATTEPERMLLDRPTSNIPDVGAVCSLEDSSLLFSSLLKGYVDAISTHRLSARQYIEDYGLDVRVLDEPLIHVAVGVAFDKDTSSDVPARLDAVLKKMEKDGSIAEIVGCYVDDPADFLEANHG